MPDSALLGFRYWNVYKNRLNPLRISERNYEVLEKPNLLCSMQWTPGINRSFCANKDPESVEYYSSPHKNCHCGFNAFFELKKLERYIKGPGDKRRILGEIKGIVGAVAGSGRIQIHRVGFRSEQAQIIALLSNRENYSLTKELSEYYSVPVFDNEKEFKDYAYSIVPDISSFKVKKTHSEEYKNSWHNLVWPLDSRNDEPSLVNDYQKFWFKDGLLHREEDLPAYVDMNGIKKWYKNGKLYREGDKPNYTIEKANVLIEEWHGPKGLHRDNGPAHIEYIKENGELKIHIQHWYKDGRRHRNDDLPAVVGANGAKLWYREGTLYKEEGLV